jgi:hypothetical protein
MSLVEKLKPFPVKIHHQRTVGDTEGFQNIIVLGGYSFNDLMKYETSSAELKARFGVEVARPAANENCDKYIWTMGEDSRTFNCTHDAAKPGYPVTRDPGMIYRYTHNDKEILVCRGLHSFGTAAALEVALMKEFHERVKRSRAREFLQFVSVEVNEGLYVNTGAIAWQGYPLIVVKTKPRFLDQLKSSAWVLGISRTARKLTKKRVR